MNGIIFEGTIFKGEILNGRVYNKETAGQSYFLENCIEYDPFVEVIVNVSKSTKIEATYNACIEFIKWYNQQNQ